MCFLPSGSYQQDRFFLTKLTLIARSGYLYGYWTALTDVQLAQQHELAEAQQIEPRKGAQNRKKGGSP